MKKVCAQCDAYVVSKTTGRERRCRLSAACHRNSENYCWVHAFKQNPNLLRTIAADCANNSKLTDREVQTVYDQLKDVRQRLQQMNIPVV